MSYAPIALFIYKRPFHTKKTIESLMNCNGFEKTIVYVFCDGSKTVEDQESVDETRSVAKSMLGERAIFCESQSNKGLANSIINGVSFILEEFDEVIVVEDDLVVDPGFLTFINQGLEKYKDEPKIMQVSGHMFRIEKFGNRTDAFFLPFCTSWGWGTWKRAWKYFDSEATGWDILNRNKEMRLRFNLNNGYDYSGMLERQSNGQIDSWAIRWYWSIFKINGYCLFPRNSYVDNIGFDDTATHGYLSAKFSLDKVFLTEKPKIVSNGFVLPENIVIDEDDYQAVSSAIGTPIRRISILINQTKMKFVKLFLGSSRR
jgi:hypothetical protein